MPFLIKTKGTIKDWTLTLAQPTNSQRSFFNGFFGTPPEARLAILHRVPATNPPRYTLRRQGAIKVLSPFLGQTVKFGSSLKVEKGDIVGISVPTWAPIFSQGLSANNVWRASREVGTCTNPTDIRQGEPQQVIGKRADYGCKYTTARLLYTATLVAESGGAPNGTGPRAGAPGACVAAWLGRGGEDSRSRLVLGERRGARDQALELVEREVADRLEDLLVGPADFTRLLVEVQGRRAVGVERLLQVEKQGRLLRIRRAEAAGAGDLVEAEPGAPSRFRVLGDAVVVLAVLGDGERDPLTGRLGENTAAELGAHPRVGPQDSGGAG